MQYLPDGFVAAYDKTTGRKCYVPAHFIGHPVLGRNLSKTPRQKAADRAARTQQTVHIPAAPATTETPAPPEKGA